MKILIFGAKGNLGEQLVKVFSTSSSDPTQENNEVIAWDKGEIDITDRTLTAKKINDLKPEIIINTVAYNAVDDIETDEGLATARKLNIEAVETLAEAALALGATIIHYSSDYVFAGDNCQGYNEDDEPRPISKYGETKRGGELALVQRSGKGLKWYLIRTSKLFGPRGSSEIAKPSFFDIMIERASEKKQLDVVDEELSCFTYTLDLAQATKALVTDDYGYGIYHIVNSEPTTWYTAAKTLFDLKKIAVGLNPVSSDMFPRPARRPKFSVLLNTKFINLRSYKEALQEYLNQ